MRTTILLPDELFAAVRRAAQEENVTISSVIERSLRAELLRGESRAQRAAYRVRPLGGRGLRVGVAFDDNADLLARMDREDEA